jgi:hypothetical protein
MSTLAGSLMSLQNEIEPDKDVNQFILKNKSSNYEISKEEF